MLKLNWEFVFWKSEFVLSKIGVCFLKIGVYFLTIGVCFLKIGVCFFENRSLLFWKWEFVFLKIGVWFFENRSLFFWKPEFVVLKMGVCFFENGSLFFWKSWFDFWKSEPFFMKIRVLAPDSTLCFCSWVGTKSVADPGEGPGEPVPPPLFLDQTETWDRQTAPLPLIWRSGRSI